MKNGHFDARGTLASLEAPKFFFNFFGFDICDRAWFQLRVAPPPAFVAPIVAEKIVSIVLLSFYFLFVVFLLSF